MKLSSEPQPVIRLHEVWKRYPNGTQALSEVNLEVLAGEFLFLVGPSGAGKSSLIKLLLREERATEGQVVVHGTDLGKLSRRRLPRLRRRVGLVHQDFKLLLQLTVRENVAFALEVGGESGESVGARVAEALEVVGLTTKGEAYPEQLSGGEQQRVGVARALVHAPELIVADEPTGNLDPATAWEIMQLLLRINAAGSTVVMATHNRDIVDLIHRRVVSLEQGRVVRDDVTGRYHENLPASLVCA
ncbi:MAG: cell division ATP-binding protein FtsE [Candidatus Dormibacteraceae bacterium]